MGRAWLALLTAACGARTNAEALTLEEASDAGSNEDGTIEAAAPSDARDVDREAAPPPDVEGDSAPGCPDGLVTLVSNSEYNFHPAAIAVDESRVYWSAARILHAVPAEGEIWSAPKCGGTPTKLVSGLQATGPVDIGYVAPAIALDATSIYWIAAFGLKSAVFHIPKGGGKPAGLGSTSGCYSSIALAVDDTNVYWTEQPDGPASCDTGNEGRVIKAPLDGGAQTVLAQGPGPQLFSIAIDDASVYWLAADGTLMKVPKGGGTATTLVAGAAPSGSWDTGGIAVGATSVYWVGDNATQPLLKVALGGGTPTTIATGTVNGFALDATRVYFSFYEGPDTLAGVATVPLQGGHVTTVASKLAAAGSMAVDGTSLYWADGRFGGHPGIVRLTPK